MKTPTLIAALAALAALATSCSGDDDDSCEFERVVFAEAEPTPTTGTPQEQIDRYVAANGLDTVVSPSGLVYAIADPGAGELPVDGDSLLVYFRGTLVDGRVFDRTPGCDPNLLILPGSQIEGFREGTRLVAPGGRITMLLPPELAYGSSGLPSRGIGPQTVLVFDVAFVQYFEQ